MADNSEPLRVALLAALADNEMSLRQFAKRCQEKRPRKSWESWQRTLRRAVAEGSTYTPEQATAELWADILGKPAGFFVRPRVRRQDRQQEELVAELGDARRELAEYRSRFGPL